MADKTIGELTKASYLDDSSLLIAEQSGQAVSVSGSLLKSFAKDAAQADVERAVKAAANAENSASAAETAADRAEVARDSIVLDEQKMAQAVEDAEGSATNAAASEQLAANHEAEAEEWANKAQGYAEQATVPAVAGVYNVVLTDRITSERYALIVESGRLKLLGVADSVDATELTLIDNGNGTSFAVVVENGKLYLKEV